MSSPSVPTEKSFPVVDLLPKKETTAASFLTKNPTYDGRGIKIAIFDTGVDPGAPGLQTTTDGKPKVIEMIDASGSGDVDTSTVVKMDPETKTITGLTGRKMKIPSDWKCPSGEFHVGIKNAYDLYSAPLKERMSNHYKEQVFSPAHKAAQADALRKLNEFLDSVKNHEKNLSREERLRKEELQAAVDNLNTIETKFASWELGPTYDCVVFHDGNLWRACVDTSDDGDLSKVKLLGPYNKTFEYSTLTPQDKLNYAVNIHGEGNLLEIVSMCGSHGTHVAAIAAAHFPDDPDKNGVAPGAQIVNIVIGFQPLGSMETTNALTRAVIKAAEIGVDVINMSYGEFAHWMGGRVMDHLAALVNRFGIVFCGSAGNHGPALNTIGTPPMTRSNCIMGIAAYVSPEMMMAEYSMRSKVPAMNYTWSSRGPTSFGDLGVSICAPGAAITSVPNFSLKCCQLMNGTSMASPNAAGCVALILSGLKQEAVSYSTFSVRRAIENTALKVSNYDPFSMGHGLIQVEKAFEHLLSHKNLVEQDVRFQVTVDTTNNGIYTRISTKETKPKVHSVLVEPIFLDDKNRSPNDKIDFNMNLVLCCDDSWVEFPQLLSLQYSARVLGIQVDPSGLSPGVHYTSVRAYDASNVKKGWVFFVPITVIVAEEVVDNNKKFVKSFPIRSLKPGEAMRNFLMPPTGSSQARIKVTNRSNYDASFYLHTLQVVSNRSVHEQEKQCFFTLQPQDSFTQVIQVRDELPMEVTLNKWWSSLKETEVSLQVEFSGLRPIPSSVVMNHSDGVKEIEICANLGYEAFTPSVSLDQMTLSIKPTDHKISPLSQREVLWEGKQLHENILTYSFSLSKPAEIMIKFPVLTGLLYESEYDCQVYVVYDSNKRPVIIADSYPKSFVKLEKGDYTIRLHVRHESVARLEKLNDLPGNIIAKLSPTVSLDLFTSHRDALIEGKKASNRNLTPGQRVSLFASSLNLDKVSKASAGGASTGLGPSSVGGCHPFSSLSSGMKLTGKFSLSKADNINGNNKSCPADNFTFCYVIDTEITSGKKKSSSPAPAASSSSSPSSPPASTSPSPGNENSNNNSNKSDSGVKSGSEVEKSIEEQYKEALIDLKLQWMSKAVNCMKGSCTPDRQQEPTASGEASSSGTTLLEERRETTSGSTGEGQDDHSVVLHVSSQSSSSSGAKSAVNSSILTSKKGDTKVKQAAKLLNDLLTEVNDLKLDLEEEKSLLVDLTRIQSLEAVKDGNIKNALLEIISLADGIISKIELKDLLGSMEEAKIDKYEGSSEATEVIRSLEKKKSQLIEALCKKGLAIIDLVEKKEEESGTPAASQTSGSEEDAKSFENVILDAQETSLDKKASSTDIPFSRNDINKVYFDLSKICKGDIISEASSNKLVAKFVERHALFVSDEGRAIKVLLKQLQSTPSEGIEQRLIDVLEKIPDWSHIRDLLLRVRHAKYPKGYIIF